MDVDGIRKFRPLKRPLSLIIPLVLLLVISVFWNLRQSRLIEEERQRAMAVQRKETARLKDEAERVERGNRGTPSGRGQMCACKNCIARSIRSAG